MDPIRLGQDCVYLTASGPIGRTFHLAIEASLAGALGRWQPSTRLSPVWPILSCAELELSPLPAGATLSGHVVFLGPHRAHDTVQDFLLPNLKPRQLKHVSLTLGMYNVVAFLTPAADFARICIAAEKAGTNWEHWELDRGRIVDVSKFDRPTSRSWVAPLQQLTSGETWAHPLKGAMEEYLPLMASALARSETALPGFTSQLVDSMKVVRNVLEQEDSNTFLQQSQVTHINAALSRLSSQMFSGVSPILATECHYWIHSLLGTGTANLGLHNLAMFIQARIGEHRLPDRIAALAERTNPPLPNILACSPSDPIATKHYLDDVDFVAPTENLIPLISYFSGRDGFKSNTTIISVPLSTISNANATPWTLQTLTHEVSHIVIEAVLSIVMPDAADDQAMMRALNLAKTPAIATNWLESLTAHVTRGFLSLHAKDSNSLDTKLRMDAAALQKVFMQEIRDVTEVLVHVFDFMYFYNSVPDTYVKGIWTSWSAIPQIADRIPEYVIRTVCAICSKHLGRPNPDSSALQQVRQLLASMNTDSPYAAAAVEYIDGHTQVIEQAVLARLPFIQFVRSFLFSPNLVGSLQADSLSVGRASRSGGYDIKRSELSENRIANPLLFVSHFTRDQVPAPAEALILWQTLAFSIANSASEEH